jgi:diaminopimelate decarboxylase
LDYLWPNTSSLDAPEGLTIGGVAIQALARAHGTPLYVYDEVTLREQAQAYRRALSTAYARSSQAAYASKAYLSTAIAQLFEQEGLDLDVVSGGELFVALRAGFPPARIHFHGNNKSVDELDEALAAGIGRVVVDNFHELALLDALAQDRGRVAPIWLRLAPGVQAHTHSHIQTGQEDTKFGFSIASGDAEAAIVEALRSRGLHLVGLHAHIGSQIYEPESLAESAERLVAFAARMHAAHGFELQELSPGGGWGVPMVDGDPEAPLEPYLSALCAAVTHACNQSGLLLPHLVIEPGRSLVARAGIAVYKVGSSKTVPGIRRYVAVDGGMADNIRPALYSAEYTAVRVAGSKGRRNETVTLAGKFCESGDILIRDISLPELDEGDLIAIPMAGAYTLSMASNYNLSQRPVVVLVRDGEAQVIQRRETYADLVRRDRALHKRGFPDKDEPGFWEKPGLFGTRAFAKYDALGNDYLVLDPVEWPDPPDPATIRQMCDRHRGIGADGVLWGPIGRDPFSLRLFNPDGGEFEKSGNGLRIFARYLWDEGLPRSRDFDILTQVGLVTAHVLDDRAGRIAMDMGCASFDASALGLATPEDEVIEEQLSVGDRTVAVTAVSMGNPHCVIFEVDGQAPEDLEVLVALAQTLGPQLEYLPLYPQRTNVQFARVTGTHSLQIAIWERGAGYTLASGTSSCAAAAAAARTGRCRSPITVQMPGGEMLVEIGDDWNVHLTGTVSRVCRGDWDPD